MQSLKNKLGIYLENQSLGLIPQPEGNNFFYVRPGRSHEAEKQRMLQKEKPQATLRGQPSSRLCERNLLDVPKSEALHDHTKIFYWGLGGYGTLGSYEGYKELLL